MKRMLYGDRMLCAQLVKRARVRRKIMAGIVMFMLAMGIFVGCDKDDDDDDPAGINNTDRDFVLRASMINFAEIKAGQVAAVKAQNDGIEDFGEMMVTEHTNAGNQLKSVASQLGLQAKDSLDAEHVRLIDTLQIIPGRAFDSVYINSQVRDHQKAISIFENEAEKGQNANLKQFANNLLPHLHMHLHHADSLRRVY